LEEYPVLDGLEEYPELGGLEEYPVPGLGLELIAAGVGYVFWGVANKEDPEPEGPA